MGYSNLPSQVERAVRAYTLLQGHGTYLNSFISLDNRVRVGRSRTFIVSSFLPDNVYIAQGRFMLEIQHIWDAIDEENPPQIESRTELDAFIGETLSCMFAQSTGNQPLTVVCDAITLAGRSLAVDESAGTDPVQVKIAANNQDMVNFRVDWLKMASPFQTRGKAELVRGTHWCEILHFTGYASYSSQALPN